MSIFRDIPYFVPTSLEEHRNRENAADARFDAMRRAHLLDSSWEAEPTCPNCGAADGRPVEVVDRDRAVGYESIEVGCTLCVRRRA